MPKATGIKTVFHGQYLPTATCDVCEWHDGGHPTTRRSAQEHTLATGHATQVEYATVTRYQKLGG